MRGWNRREEPPGEKSDDDDDDDDDVEKKEDDVKDPILRCVFFQPWLEVEGK
jgi:hypothetical protein